MSFVDNSGTGSQIAGGNGADGTSANPAGGNGGPGILIDDAAVNPSMTIGADVEVVGGNGGTAFAGSGANGGNGGAGVDGDVAENDGTITGGNAGNGDTGGEGGTGGAASTGTIGDNNGQPGTTANGENGTSGSGAPTVNPDGGATWLDGSALRMVAIAPDGENMALTFSVPLEAEHDFANWVQLSVAHRKLAVVVADSLPAMASVELTTLLNGGTAEGVRVIYVGTAACSSSSAEFVSSDATAKTITIRVPKTSQTAGFYRVCVLD